MDRGKGQPEESLDDLTRADPAFTEPIDDFDATKHQHFLADYAKVAQLSWLPVVHSTPLPLPHSLDAGFSFAMLGSLANFSLYYKSSYIDGDFHVVDNAKKRVVCTFKQQSSVRLQLSYAHYFLAVETFSPETTFQCCFFSEMYFLLFKLVPQSDQTWSFSADVIFRRDLQGKVYRPVYARAVGRDCLHFGVFQGEANAWPDEPRAYSAFSNFYNIKLLVCSLRRTALQGHPSSWVFEGPFTIFPFGIPSMQLFANFVPVLTAESLSSSSNPLSYCLFLVNGNGDSVLPPKLNIFPECTSIVYVDSLSSIVILSSEAREIRNANRWPHTCSVVSLLPGLNSAEVASCRVMVFNINCTLYFFNEFLFMPLMVNEEGILEPSGAPKYIGDSVEDLGAIIATSNVAKFVNISPWDVLSFLVDIVFPVLIARRKLSLQATCALKLCQQLCADISRLKLPLVDLVNLGNVIFSAFNADGIVAENSFVVALFKSALFQYGNSVAQDRCNLIRRPQWCMSIPDSRIYLAEYPNFETFIRADFESLGPNSFYFEPNSANPLFFLAERCDTKVVWSFHQCCAFKQTSHKPSYFIEVANTVDQFQYLFCAPNYLVLIVVTTSSRGDLECSLKVIHPSNRIPANFNLVSAVANGNASMSLVYSSRQPHAVCGAFSSPLYIPSSESDDVKNLVSFCFLETYLNGKATWNVCDPPLSCPKFASIGSDHAISLLPLPPLPQAADFVRNDAPLIKPISYMIKWNFFDFEQLEMYPQCNSLISFKLGSTSFVAVFSAAEPIIQDVKCWYHVLGLLSFGEDCQLLSIRSFRERSVKTFFIGNSLFVFNSHTYLQVRYNEEKNYLEICDAPAYIGDDLLLDFSVTSSNESFKRFVTESPFDVLVYAKNCWLLAYSLWDPLFARLNALACAYPTCFIERAKLSMDEKFLFLALLTDLESFNSNAFICKLLKSAVTECISRVVL